MGGRRFDRCHLGLSGWIAKRTQEVVRGDDAVEFKFKMGWRYAKTVSSFRGKGV